MAVLISKKNRTRKYLNKYILLVVVLIKKMLKSISEKNIVKIIWYSEGMDISNINSLYKAMPLVHNSFIQLLADLKC